MRMRQWTHEIDLALFACQISLAVFRSSARARLAFFRSPAPVGSRAILDPGGSRARADRVLYEEVAADLRRH